MHRLTRFSLSKVPIVIMLAILVIAAGVISAGRLKTELLPDIGFPGLSIITVYPGAGPEDVRRDITDPIQKAVAGTANLESLRATSNDSVSFVSVQYQYGTDMEKMQQTVQQLLDTVTLPTNAQTPRIGRFSFQDIPIVAYTLNTSETGEDALVNLKRKVDEQLTPELQAIEGVNSVVVSGGGERNLVIIYDPAKLSANGLTATSVNGVLQANNISFPAGDIISNNQNIPVRVTHQFSSTEDLKNLIVGFKMPAGAGAGAGAGANGAGGNLSNPSGGGAQGSTNGGGGAGTTGSGQTGATGAVTNTTGTAAGATGTVTNTTGTAQGATQQGPTPVKLGDVATVELRNASGDSISRSNGKPSISVVIYKTQNANTVDVAHKVDDVITKVEPTIGTEAVTLFDSATYIEDSLNSLVREGVLGAILAIIVILAFLLSVRSTLVTAVSIPISVLIAFILLNVMGVSLNIMSLAGLAVAVGRVVDDSIVVLENIFRHVSEGESVKEAAFNGTKEVATAITASTITTVCVFLPLGFLAGLISEIFRPFAIAVSVALLASLFVALTIVPVLASLFIKAGLVRKQAAREERDTLVQRLYTPTLKFVLRNRGTKLLTLGLAIILFVASLIPLAAGAIGFTFISIGSDKVLTANFSLAAGSDLQTTSDVATGIENQVRTDPMVSNYQTTIGAGGGGLAASAGFGGGGSGSSSNSGQLTVTLKKEADLNAEADSLRTLLKNTDKVVDSSVDTGSGTGFDSSGFSAVVTGNDYNDVVRVSNELTDRLKNVPDLVNVKNDAAQAKPELRIQVDPVKALQHGSTTIQIASQIRNLLTSQNITSVTIDGTSYDVLASYDPTSTDSADKIKAILVGTVNPVPLSEVATVDIEDGPVSISEVDQNRAVTVSGTITGKSTSGVTKAATEAIDAIQKGAGTTVTIGGVTQQQTRAFGDMFTAIGIAIALVYIVMVTTFGSLSTPFVILFSLPLAAIGSFLGLWITGKPLGVSALIGVLMLIGIVVTNAIVLLDLVEQFKKQGMSTYDALIRGGRTRVRPIVMTAIATIIALIPLALSGEGLLIAAELGTVVIGGLFSSTFLTLIVIPVIYSLLDSVRSRFSGRGERAEEEPVASSARVEPEVDSTTPAPEREPIPAGARKQQQPAV